jgi:hypothetical protein
VKVATPPASGVVKQPASGRRRAASAVLAKSMTKDMPTPPFCAIL